jgi:hypothetical protein
MNASMKLDLNMTHSEASSFFYALTPSFHMSTSFHYVHGFRRLASDTALC